MSGLCTSSEEPLPRITLAIVRPLPSRCVTERRRRPPSQRDGALRFPRLFWLNVWLVVSVGFYHPSLCLCALLPRWCLVVTKSPIPGRSVGCGGASLLYSRPLWIVAGCCIKNDKTSIIKHFYYRCHLSNLILIAADADLTLALLTSHFSTLQAAGLQACRFVLCVHEQDFRHDHRRHASGCGGILEENPIQCSRPVAHVRRGLASSRRCCTSPRRMHCFLGLHFLCM